MPYNKQYKTTRIEIVNYMMNDIYEIRNKLSFYKELIEDITGKRAQAIHYNDESHDLSVRLDDESVVLRNAGTNAREITINIINHFSDYKNKELARELRKSLQRALRENNFYSRLDVDERK